MISAGSNVSTEYKGKVLVVDDESKNRELLHDLLEVKGYTVTEAVDGEDALQKTSECIPDVILLDVMMPKLNGFEVCQRLRSDSKTAHIPILLVTALSDRSDRLEGIKAGANDFLTKPIDSQDVLLRVRNAVYSKHLFDQVQDDLKRLKELETLRDNLTNMIVHDMRSPLMGINGFAQLLKMQVKDRLSEEENSFLENIHTSALRLNEMVSSLLDVSRLEVGEMPLKYEICDLVSLVENALKSLGSLAITHNVQFEKPKESIALFCDKELIQRVIGNLVGNAIKFTPKDGYISVKTEKLAEGVKICVIDTGPGIPPEYHQKIFEKFGQVEAHKQSKKFSTGLGLAFCKLAVEAHKGKIGV
ncbi:MAG: response regulator, partial [Deltaproteobacteria bacterium]|nr:response regulator [Deltaproteobacteria bacterium]